MSDELRDIWTRISAERAANEEFARKVDAWLEGVKKELAESEVRRKAAEAELQKRRNIERDRAKMM